MRISVFTSSYPRYPGDSTAPFVKSICEHLAKSGHDIEVIAPYDPFCVETDPEDVPVHRFRYIWPSRLHIMGHGHSLRNDMQLHPLAILLLPLYLLASFSTLMRVTIRQRSQAIHAHWVIPNGLVAAWVASLRNIPLIISLHGSDIFLAKSNALFRAVARWVFSRAAGVSACSPELQQEALALGAPRNTQIIPWGVNPSIFRPDRKIPKRYTYLGINESNIVITALGRLVNKKGFGTLIDAIPTIVKKAPQAHILLGGDGAQINQLLRQAEELGVLNHITFVGNVLWSEVPDFLANADIFVLPSMRDERGNIDGMPTVLLEAMSSGVAIVASDIGGVSLVIEDNKNGILVPPGDARALAAAILDLVHDSIRRSRIGHAARQDVETRFTWAMVSQHFTELFETAA